MAKINLAEIKLASEAVVCRHGGQICDWLPSPDPEAQPRSVDAVARRALILNAILQISFNAPTQIINRWIRANELESDLAESERIILSKSNAALNRNKQICGGPLRRSGRLCGGPV
jgi:hypothetical protein